MLSWFEKGRLTKITLRKGTKSIYCNRDKNNYRERTSMIKKSHKVRLKQSTLTTSAKLTTLILKNTS